jgi:hypothetical protein
VQVKHHTEDRLMREVSVKEALDAGIAMPPLYVSESTRDDEIVEEMEKEDLVLRW